MSARRPYHGFIGVVILLLAEMLMLAGIRPFDAWFYSLAWWPYIFIVDQAVYSLKGESLWVSRRREFLLLIPLSVFFWMIFEGLNVYLQNWRYLNLPADIRLRWPGYFIAYATVLPALFETKELLEAWGLFARVKTRPIALPPAWRYGFTLFGLVSLALVIFLPRYFFPLTWLFFIFLLEPVLYTRRGNSLMREIEEGRFRTLLELLAAGLICGILWEFWNFWAASKWTYTVPFFNWLKIFEMPLLGFLGFPPFAVECWVMYQFVNLLRRRGEKVEARPDAAGKATLPLALAGLVIFVAIFFLTARLIDVYTVISMSCTLRFCLKIRGANRLRYPLPGRPSPKTPASRPASFALHRVLPQYFSASPGCFHPGNRRGSATRGFRSA